MGLFWQGMLRINKIQRQTAEARSRYCLRCPSVGTKSQCDYCSGPWAAPDNSFTAATITEAGGLDLDTQLTNWEQDYN